jgi:hypothetical protein
LSAKVFRCGSSSRLEKDTAICNDPENLTHLVYSCT